MNFYFHIPISLVVLLLFLKYVNRKLLETYLVTYIVDWMLHEPKRIYNLHVFVNDIVHWECSIKHILHWAFTAKYTSVYMFTVNQALNQIKP